MLRKAASLAVCSLALLISWIGLLPMRETALACSVESPAGGGAGSLVKHLSSDCTSTEREAHAVSSAAIMEALAKGRPVDLIGVIVRGDLILDGLAKQTTQSGKGQTSEPQTSSNPANVEELRIVRGAVTIRDSVVSGAVRHRSSKGTLQFEGPIDFHGTLFKDGVDLSRSVFRDTVELSGATFKKEAYFVQAQFTRALSCKETKFGPHTRFHRSLFGGPVDCTGALFDGLVEFLETSFDQSVSFDRARFGLGTGFSGSRFKQRADFAEAIFSRETFFGFSMFEGETSFANAQFLSSADFSDAEFNKPDDLSKVRFDQPPLFVRTKRVVQDQPADFQKSPTGQYALALCLLIIAAVLVAYAFRMK